MGGNHSEWLVADQRGTYAMGTCDGIRTRKYHGLQMGIVGRSQLAYLVDLDFECNGISLWPHCYSGPEGLVFFPSLKDTLSITKFDLTATGPRWVWTLPDGKLGMRVEASFPSGIFLRWQWTSKSQKTARLKLRGFWAMRDLHSTGGRQWAWAMKKIEDRWLATITSQQGDETCCLLKGNWIWEEDPKWYRNFHYTEELARGYDADENLYSAGILSTELTTGEECAWLLNRDGDELFEGVQKQPEPKICDFILTRPAGVIAGFPWFGEWGRDTFVSLPGIVASFLNSGKNPTQVWIWARELIRRWGTWIERKGMLPNLLGKNGEVQWESADATLWWCHSLAALWAFSLCTPPALEEVRSEFGALLSRAIESIRGGHHLFLRENQNGLVEVTEGHTTWMDARIQGVPVTPRTGTLPEINSLWFEARCLQWLWSEDESDFEVERIGKAVLQCREPDRPNTIFLHSLPLAPSFVLKRWDLLEADLREIAENFWTPMGLRTLRPSHPDFKRHCVGSAFQRDTAYHQGPVWAWLGGHYEMARNRLVSRTSDGLVSSGSRSEKMLNPRVLREVPICEHVPEIFDAEPPFTARGAPAQAWSLACLEEAKGRRRLKVDSRISKVLAQRWLGREQRKARLHQQDERKKDVEAMG